MANDRLFIKCGTCGAWKMLMKHYAGTLATADNGALAWLDAHGDCHPHLYDNNLGGLPGFSLHTEAALKSGELLADRQNAMPPLSCPQQETGNV